MKGLNFWQWLGIVLLIGGLVLILRRPTSKNADKTPGGTSAVQTTPATTPVTQP